VQNRLTAEQWNDLVTPGSALNRRWIAQIDVVAEFLKILRESRIPVLWRPYHEMNGGWFWWGGKRGENGYPALWRLMYDRYVNHHRLHNLIWVWNTNAPVKGVDPYHPYYPGHAFVDILATDVYGNEYKQQFHDDLVTLAEGKPVALGEVGDMPAPGILDHQPQWRWFMTWTNFLEKNNTLDEILTLYRDPRVLTREEVKI
jgi:mannan endo-1,4-beta-mannosidase